MAHETILVIDDEALIRRTVGKRLQSAGYDVLEAETGQQALERAATGVDLAILDYRLPDIDGLAVLKQLKQLDPDILVILLTAYANVESAVSAMKLGAFISSTSRSISKRWWHWSSRHSRRRSCVGRSVASARRRLSLTVSTGSWATRRKSSSSRGC